jgi:hypothetical protein
MISSQFLCSVLDAGVLADYETLGRQPPPVRGSLSRDYETVRSSIGTTTLSSTLPSSQYFLDD